METPRVVRENLGYALLGGPALAAVSFLAGAHFLGTATGVAVAVGTYALGWALSARRSGSAPERSSSGQPASRRPASDADDDREHREREAEAGKGGFGGGGGG